MNKNDKKNNSSNKSQTCKLIQSETSSRLTIKKIFSMEPVKGLAPFKVIEVFDICTAFIGKNKSISDMCVIN